MIEVSTIGRSGLVLVLGLALAAWAVPHGKKDWPVPEAAKKLRNPLPPSEASLRSVKDLYTEKCARCHGDEGKGDGPEAPMYSVQPADLTDAHMMSEMTDGEIFWKISEGRQPMPSFKKQLTEEQRWQLVRYLRTFARKAAKAPAPAKAAPRKH